MRTDPLRTAYRVTPIPLPKYCAPNGGGVTFIYMFGISFLNIFCENNIKRKPFPPAYFVPHKGFALYISALRTACGLAHSVLAYNKTFDSFRMKI